MKLFPCCCPTPGIFTLPPGGLVTMRDPETDQRVVLDASPTPKPARAFSAHGGKKRHEKTWPNGFGGLQCGHDFHGHRHPAGGRPVPVFPASGSSGGADGCSGHQTSPWDLCFLCSAFMLIWRYMRLLQNQDGPAGPGPGTGRRKAAAVEMNDIHDIQGTASYSRRSPGSLPWLDPAAAGSPAGGLSFGLAPLAETQKTARDPDERSAHPCRMKRPWRPWQTAPAPGRIKDPARPFYFRAFGDPCGPIWRPGTGFPPWR